MQKKVFNYLGEVNRAPTYVKFNNISIYFLNKIAQIISHFFVQNLSTNYTTSKATIS